MNRIELVFEDAENRPVAGSDEKLECALGIAVADFYEVNEAAGATSDMLMIVVAMHMLGVLLNVVRGLGIAPDEFPGLVKDIAESVVAQTCDDVPARVATTGVFIGHA